jgi:aspartate/glutamate racemase
VKRVGLVGGLGRTRRTSSTASSRCAPPCLRDTRSLDGVVLGDTELPLLLGAPTVAGLPALDTTALHVDAIVARLRA